VSVDVKEEAGHARVTIQSSPSSVSPSLPPSSHHFLDYAPVKKPMVFMGRQPSRRSVSSQVICLT